MIEHKMINGISLIYELYDPKVDDISAAYKPGATVKELGQGSDVAINFNYADKSKGLPIGRLIVNSVEVVKDIPKTVARDELFMTMSGTLGIGSKPRTPLKWAIQGSPRLLKGGKNVIAESIKRDQLSDDVWDGHDYRTAAGITEEGNLVIVRTNDKTSLDGLEKIMRKLGCVDALNGDGGGSSYMWPEDSGWGRKVGSALVIKRGVTNMLIGDLDPEVIIDPGHGGADPGAGGNGIIEKVLTLEASMYMFKRFGELGIRRALTRDKDITLSPADRTRMIRNSRAKYCLSNHINAGGGDGVETIHSVLANSSLATIVASEIVKAGQNLRRVFTRKNSSGTDYYYMHRDTGSVHTVIVEYFFLDSKGNDVTEYKDEYLDWVEGAVKGYCLHTGRKYTPPNVEVEEDIPSVGVKAVVFDKEIKGAKLIDGVTMLPLRAVGDAIGGIVSWDKDTMTARIDK